MTQPLKTQRADTMKSDTQTKTATKLELQQELSRARSRLKTVARMLKKHCAKCGDLYNCFACGVNETKFFLKYSTKN
jgi:hypothetical protein